MRCVTSFECRTSKAQCHHGTAGATIVGVLLAASTEEFGVASGSLQYQMATSASKAPSRETREVADAWRLGRLDQWSVKKGRVAEGSCVCLSLSLPDLMEEGRILVRR